MTRTNKKTMITVLCLALTLFFALAAVSALTTSSPDAAHAEGKTFSLGAEFYYGDTITVSETQYLLDDALNCKTTLDAHDYTLAEAYLVIYSGTARVDFSWREGYSNGSTAWYCNETGDPDSGIFYGIKIIDGVGTEEDPWQCRALYTTEYTFDGLAFTFDTTTKTLNVRDDGVLKRNTFSGNHIEHFIIEDDADLSIPESYFAGFRTLQEIVIPESVVSLGNQCFDLLNNNADCTITLKGVREYEGNQFSYMMPKSGRAITVEYAQGSTYRTVTYTFYNETAQAAYEEYLAQGYSYSYDGYEIYSSYDLDNFFNCNFHSTEYSDPIVMTPENATAVFGTDVTIVEIAPPVTMIAMVGETEYDSLVDAYTACAADGTVKLLNDVDLSAAGANYLSVEKNIRFDLNGYTLTLNNDADIVVVIGGAVLTLDNSVPATGGIIGACGVDVENDSYALLRNCRLSVPVAFFNANLTVFNRIADGFTMKDIPGAPVDGFYSIVRPITDQEYADEVIALIDVIGEVTCTQASKDKIDAARNAYDGLTNEQKALVNNYSTLTTAESAYATLQADKEAADVVIALIDDITLPVDYPGSDIELSEARTAYDNLTADQKALVTNYDDLTAAETSFNDQKMAGVNAVKDLIDAIGEVTYTQDCKDKIDAAREAYDDLITDEQQALVTNYSTLTVAETEYNNQKVAGVNAVKDLIDTIGEVKYPDSGDAITNARNAYEALTAEQKALVTNYTTLTTAETSYNDQKVSGANAVKEMIENIGEVTYPASEQAIENAKNAYENLTPEQKALIDNHNVLTTAEDTYEVKEVIAFIENIGDVEYTEASKDKIEAAKVAYALLSDEQKAQVANYGALTGAEATYLELKEANKPIDEPTEPTVNPEPTEEPTVEPEPTEEPKPTENVDEKTEGNKEETKIFGLPIYAVAGIAAGAVLLLIVIIIIIQKKKNNGGSSSFPGM